MNKRYAQVISLDRFNNGEPTIVADVTHHTMIVDGGTEFINGEWVEIRSSKHYLSGEVVERLYELEEKATPKKPITDGSSYLPSCNKVQYICPHCKQIMLRTICIKAHKPNYCYKCGQALDWGEDDE